MPREDLETVPETTQSREFSSHQEAIEKAVALCQRLYPECIKIEGDRERLIATLETQGEHVRAGQFDVSVEGNKVYVCVSGNPFDSESAKSINEAWEKI